MQDAFAPTREPGWTLVNESFDVRRESSVEARFALGNGFLGVRAARAVSRASIWLSFMRGQTWTSWPRTYVAGLFDAPDTDPPVPALVPLADWRRVRITIDGEPLLLRTGETLQHHRTLDMRRGLLLADWRQRTPAGAGVRVQTLSLVSLADRAIGLQLLQVKVDGKPSQVTLEASFEGAGLGMATLRQEQDLGFWRAEQSGRTLAMTGHAALTATGRDLAPDTRIPLTWRWNWISSPGETVSLTRFVAAARGDTTDDNPQRSARQALSRATTIGWRAALSAHETAWAARWADSDIVGGRRHGSRAGAAICGLSPEQCGQSGRRTCLDRRAGADRRQLSRPRLLGHRDLPAAILHPDLARSGARAADVPLSHAGRRSGEGRRRRVARRDVCLGIRRHRRGDDAGPGDDAGRQAGRRALGQTGAAHHARTSPMRSGSIGRPPAMTRSWPPRAQRSCWTPRASGPAAPRRRPTATATSAT